MVVATDLNTKPRNSLKDKKTKILTMREPVVLPFKPDISRTVIDAAVKKVISELSSHK